MPPVSAPYGGPLLFSIPMPVLLASHLLALFSLILSALWHLQWNSDWLTGIIPTGPWGRNVALPQLSKCKMHAFLGGAKTSRTSIIGPAVDASVWGGVGMAPGDEDKSE